MGSFIDLTGRKFSRLTVRRRDMESFPASKGRKVKWVCSCDCGRVISAIGKNLVNGNTKSCGCLAVEILRTNSVTHGRSKQRVYNIWQHMHRRCRDPKHVVYAFYGGKGVKVCERWAEFELFLADMGEPSPDMTLDRIDPFGNYEPDNCRWALMADQHNNLRKSVTWKGERLAVAEVSRRVGVPRTSLNKLLNKGMGIEDAVAHAVARVKTPTPPRESPPTA